MKNLKTIKIKNDLWELRESKDCIIKTKVKDGHYTNYYNLFKQDNIVIEGVEEKEPNHYIFENWWHNDGIDCGYDAYGYTYYVTIEELLKNIEQLQLPKEFIEELILYKENHNKKEVFGK